LVIIPFLILSSFFLRAERWRILVKNSPPIRYWSSFSALMIGYLFNNILPARAGDVVRALELGKTENLSRTKVLVTLVIERVFDLLLTLTILACVMLSYPKLPDWLKVRGAVLSIVVFLVVIGLSIFHFFGKKWLPIVMSKIRHMLPLKIEKKISSMMLSALEGVQTVFSKKRVTKFLFITSLLWIIEVFIIYFCAAASNIPMALGNALFVLLILAIGLMIPASPGFVGTYEFFGITALNLIGIEGPSALTFVILLHVFSLAGSTVLGVTCLIIKYKKSKT